MSETNERNYRRVATRVHTRELDRKIARKSMKKHGLHRVAKHGYNHGLALSGKPGETTRTDSYFANHWREFT